MTSHQPTLDLLLLAQTNRKPIIQRIVNHADFLLVYCILAHFHLLAYHYWPSLGAIFMAIFSLYNIDNIIIT